MSAQPDTMQSHYGQLSGVQQAYLRWLVVQLFREDLLEMAAQEFHNEDFAKLPNFQKAEVYHQIEQLGSTQYNHQLERLVFSCLAERGDIHTMTDLVHAVSLHLERTTDQSVRALLELSGEISKPTDQWRKEGYDKLSQQLRKAFPGEARQIIDEVHHRRKLEQVRLRPETRKRAV